MRFVLDITFSQASKWYEIHSEIFMSESRMESCWSRSGPLRAEVTTQGLDMNNDESLCLTLKLRRGLKKELNTGEVWPVEVGRTNVDRTDQGGLGEIASSREPTVDTWALGVTKGRYWDASQSAIRPLPHVVLSRSHWSLAYKTCLGKSYPFFCVLQRESLMGIPFGCFESIKTFNPLKEKRFIMGQALL